MKEIKPCFCGNTNPDEFVIKTNKMTCCQCNTMRVSTTTKSVEEMIKVWNIRGATPVDHSDAKHEALLELEKHAEDYLWHHNTLNIHSNDLGKLLQQFCRFYANRV